MGSPISNTFNEAVWRHGEPTESTDVIKRNHFNSKVNHKEHNKARQNEEWRWNQQFELISTTLDSDATLITFKGDERQGITRKNKPDKKISEHKIPPRMLLVVQHSISAYNTSMLINTEVHGGRMFEEWIHYLSIDTTIHVVSFYGEWFLLVQLRSLVFTTTFSLVSTLVQQPVVVKK